MSPASLLPEYKFLGFTGHRELNEPARVQRGVDEAISRAKSRLHGVEWLAVSSVAAGADVLFVQNALKQNIAWHAVLPLSREDFSRDFLPADWATVEGLLAQAEQIAVVPPATDREEAYLDAGLEVVDRCDVLIAVWNGAPARGKGGVAEVVTYAREIGRPLYIVDSVTGEITEENISALAEHDPLLAGVNALPPSQIKLNYANRPSELVDFMARADEGASAGAPHFRRMVAGTVLLHVTATLVAVSALVYHWHWVGLPWVKLACLLGALGVALFLSRRHAHHRWLRQRIAAEVCRSALSAWGLPRVFRFFDTIQHPDLRGLTRSIQVLHLRHRQKMTLAEFKAAYLAERIEDQAAYYRKQEMKAGPLLRNLRMGFWFATVAAIIATAAYSVTVTAHVERVSEMVQDAVFYLLPICLPVIAAGCMSFVAINDLQRRVARYHESQAMLERSKRQLAATHSWNSVVKVVESTEQGLLHEVLEWHSIAQYAESH